MRIRIQGDQEFNQRQRELERGIVIMLPSAPKIDPIQEKLDFILANQEALKSIYQVETSKSAGLESKQGSTNERCGDEVAPLSVKEVATLLGKSEKTIRRWTEREHHPLPVIKVPCHKQNTWNFQKSEVLEWFNLFQRN
jgi:predicted DNA-binding transcriptional regulator AlpA